MKISRLKIRNFRGIKEADLLLPDHVVLIGDNNTGKSTVLDAIDLVLGPERLNRRPVINEHDFYRGQYLLSGSGISSDESTTDSGCNDVPTTTTDDGKINIEAIITGLSSEQEARFRNYIEWWCESNQALYSESSVEGVDEKSVVSALRVAFIGQYDAEEDDFDGRTYFARTLEENEKPEHFSKRDKQYCGFLYLRSLRTGSRALSLEYGSLLDIILRLKEIRPQMWENVIQGLASFDVASDPELGISGILESVNSSLAKYVPKEWGARPHLRVSSLTREHLRKVVTAFVATGKGEHSAPYFRQGTGTINMLVLAMLSQIAEDKQNVIFAMEEPEIAIPPYAQKRIIHEVKNLSSQALFTSHSPYVLEEFTLTETVVLSRDDDGLLAQASVELPHSVKHKRYRQEFRTRFCEGLLSRRILIAEGATEAAAIPAVARRLSELDPSNYASLEALGITTIDAGSESQIADLAQLYRKIGKTVYAVCDKQSPENQATIESHVDKLFMHSEAGLEDLVLKETSPDALERFVDQIDFPPHLTKKYPSPKKDIIAAVRDYFSWSKGSWGIADFLAICQEDEIPNWFRDSCKQLRDLCQAKPHEKHETNGTQTTEGGSSIDSEQRETSSPT